MQPKHALTARLANLQSWRYGVTTQIVRVADFLREHGYSNSETEATFDRLTKVANSARVNIVLIAEAGRGKSELINALFFPDIGRRLLPSGEKHATRCITEIRFDRERRTGLRLLPIESREAPRRFADIYADDAEWQEVPFDADVPASIDSAFALLAETRRATIADTVSWGLHSESIHNTSSAGYVEVPRWRYAVINYPHPILDAGLVVIDTPGLAALTAEPEFSRENIPTADAVIVVLDANEGVTKADLSIWKDKLGGSRNFREREKDESTQARIVVMNKIDLLFKDNELDPKEADRIWLKEVDRRVQDVADLMRVEPIKVIPVSAQLALEGAFAGNQDMQLKSRLYRLERAVASSLPEHREIALGKDILNTLSSTLESVQGSLDQARFDALEGLRALGDVRKKNQAISDALARETGDKRQALVAALDELRAIKPIHGKLSNELASLTSPAIAKQDATETSNRIGSKLMGGKINDALADYFSRTRGHLAAIDAKLDEIRTLFGNLGEKHFRLIGLGHHELHPFATNRFQIEIDKAEQSAAAELTRSGNLLVRRASGIADQFETVIAPQVIHIFEIAHRESTTWMRGIFLGIERPLTELNKRLSERAAKIDVIRAAELDLAEKIADFQAQLDVIKSKHAELGVLREGLERFAGRKRPQES
jgi:GTPase SAR1 family protein